MSWSSSTAKFLNSLSCVWAYLVLQTIEMDETQLIWAVNSWLSSFPCAYNVCVHYISLLPSGPVLVINLSR